MSTFVSVTSYTISAVSWVGPSQVAEGSDGRIWGYIEDNPSALFFAVTPGGAVATYTAPYNGVSSGAVLVGSDVWMTPATTKNS